MNDMEPNELLRQHSSKKLLKYYSTTTGTLLVLRTESTMSVHPSSITSTRLLLRPCMNWFEFIIVHRNCRGGWQPASQQFVWIRLYIIQCSGYFRFQHSSRLCMLLGWLGLACLGYLFTQLQRCEPAVQLLLPLLSNPDSSLESDDHNT